MVSKASDTGPEPKSGITIATEFLSPDGSLNETGKAMLLLEMQYKVVSAISEAISMGIEVEHATGKWPPLDSLAFVRQFYANLIDMINNVPSLRNHDLQYVLLTKELYEQLSKVRV